MKFIPPFILIIFCSIYCLSQDVAETDQNARFRLGVEAGIGFNNIVENVDFSFFSMTNPGLFLETNYTYYPRKSILGFSTGFRYQRKRYWKSNFYFGTKSDHIIIPVDLRFHLFKDKFVGLYLKPGAALEMNFVDKKNENANKFNFNWRLGVGILFKINSSFDIGLQVQRTASLRTQVMEAYSPGGAPYDIVYNNIGQEFGVSLIRKIRN